MFKKKKEDYGDLRSILAASSIGLVFVCSVLIGYAIGWWVDKKFNTAPWGITVFMITGVISGFKNAYVFVKKAEVLAQKEEKKNMEESGKK